MASSKQPETKEIIYSALEVAKICGVVNQTAINWIKAGHLPAFKTPGGQFRVYKNDLVAFMTERKMELPAELIKSSESVFKLLIVDDDEGLNNVLSQFIAKKLPQIQIIQAYDGFEAGAKTVKEKPDCIILDLDLPGIDGTRLCKKITSSEEFGTPKIIIITALNDDEKEKACKKFGISQFFHKPLFLPELVSSIQQFIN